MALKEVKQQLNGEKQKMRWRAKSLICLILFQIFVKFCLKQNKKTQVFLISLIRFLLLFLLDHSASFFGGCCWHLNKTSFKEANFFKKWNKNKTKQNKKWFWQQCLGMGRRVVGAFVSYNFSYWVRTNKSHSGQTGVDFLATEVIHCVFSCSYWWPGVWN